MRSDRPTAVPRPILSLALLTGINLFNYFDRSVLNAVLGPLQKDFRLSDGQVGFAATAFMIGYFATSPAFGVLGDRFSRKWLCAAGVLCWSVGTILTGLAPGYVSLLLCRGLVGLGEASYAALAPGWLADLFDRKRRNLAQTIFCVGLPVGYALGYAFGGFVEKHYGWRNAFFAAGVPGLALALGLLLLREPARGAMDGDGGAAEAPTGGDAHGGGKLPHGRDVLGLFRLGTYNVLLLGYTAYTFALGGFAVWAPQFLARVHGLPNDRATLFFGATLVVCGLVSTLVGGALGTAWQRRTPGGYAWVLAVSALLGMPLATAAFLVHGAFAAQACLAGSMLALFLLTGPINTLILETVPVALRASAMAVTIFVIHLFGDLGSPWMVGKVSDLLGGNLRRAILILPAMLAVSAGLWTWLAVRQPANGRKPRLATPGVDGNSPFTAGTITGDGEASRSREQG